ncbi:Ribosomal rna processing protein 1-like protein [Thalictrum thalictroides]|uniref:Ribosomal rna processing protein 1-like protein n=1 Tax=Thalictrum thalictroides TaxID=46969 RepID=A0A7J6UZQ7_THATH|nr:Ribosomal rna processing protein 1-like protein [Thalictrum thalictroides]
MASSTTTTTTTVDGSSLIIKHLASCDKTTRDRALRLLKTWLPTRTQVDEDEMKRIWKGLFYCIWHADKQPVQIELINRLSSLLVSLDLSLAIQYFEIYLLTLRREWSGIDYLRLDKFYLLNRRFLCNLFALFNKNRWDLELVKRLMSLLEQKALFSIDNFPAQGVNYHFADIFLDELKAFLPLGLETVDILLNPFVSVLGNSLDKILLNKIKSSLFGCLLEHGRRLLERKKVAVDGNAADEEGASGSGPDEVELFGTIGLKLGLANKFFDLGSSPDCVQGNRKDLFSLHMDFDKLEKDLANSGINISIPQVRNEIDEDEVPELVPITQMEVEKEAVNGSLDKPSKKKKKVKKQMELGQEISNGSTEKLSKKSKKAKKESGGSGTKKFKKNKDLSSNDVELRDASENENTPNDGGLITFNGTLMSNLQMQFERVAAEVGMETDGANTFDSPASPVTPVNAIVPKKRKRARSNDGKISLNDDLIEGSTAGKSAKKVRFAMKSNLVWKPHSPLPPQSLRLPPSATPRGSALKKGIPAGPIIETSSMTKKVKRRVNSLKKARKGLKSASPSVKRLKTLRSLSV